VLNTLSGVLEQMGRLEEALEALERALAITEDQKDFRQLVIVLNSLGGVLQQLDRPEEALEALQRARAEAENDPRQLVKVLNTLNGVLQQMGRLEEALEALERVRDIAGRWRDDIQLLISLNGLGGLLRQLSRFPEGIEALERARGIAERRNDERPLRIAVSGLAKIRTVFGKTLVAQDEVDQALPQLRCAFDLNEAAVNKRGLAIVTPILVDLLRQLGRHVEADEILCRTWVLAPDVEPKQPRVVPESNPRYPAIRLTGRVKRLLERSDGLGYGFITSDDGGPDIYVAEHQVGEQYGGLYEDAPVAVEAFTTPEGRRVARNVTIQEE